MTASLLLAWLAAAPSTAAEAQFLEDQARRAFSRGRVRDALELFSQLVEVAPDPINIFNAAYAADAAGRPRLAFSLYERYLRLRADAPEDDPVKREAVDSRDRLARGLALVDVVSAPPGARIVVDGSDIGAFERTPATVSMKPGPHALRISLEGHVPVEVEVRAVRGRRESVSVALTPRRGQLEVRIEEAPVETVSLVDGDARLEIPVGRAVDVDVGRYVIEVDAPGYEPLEVPVVVPFGRPEVRRLSLVPLPVPTGRVLVRTAPRSGELWVDGQRRSSTPVAMDLPAGVHELEVRVDDRVAWSDRVLVIEGDAVLFDVDVADALAD